MEKTNYPAGDFLVRIKNAALARRRNVTIGKTKLIKAIAEVLKKEGFVQEVKTDGKNLVVQITYRKKEPVLMKVELISKPGLRIYMSADELDSFKGPEIFIVSTSKGIVSSKEAIKKRMGGEVIVRIL